MLPLPFSVAAMLVLSLPAAGAELPLERISLPQRFAIELVARVPNAHEMALGAGGTLSVGSMPSAPTSLRSACASYRISYKLAR